MTEKQRKCIDWICSVLGMEYCGIDSVNSARAIYESWGNPDDSYNMEEWKV